MLSNKQQFSINAEIQKKIEMTHATDQFYSHYKTTTKQLVNASV